MSIKMIVTDLDSTLLRTDKSISDYTIKIFAECKKRGIKIIFATARAMRSVKPYLEEIKCDGVICHNGTMVHFDGKEIYKTGINYVSTKNVLLNILRDNPNARLAVAIDDIFYANFDVSTIWNDTTALNSDFTDLPNKNADKLFVGASSLEDIKNIEKYLPDDLYIQLSENTLGIIIHKEATKLNGILHILKKCDIDISEIIAFGDDYNDIEMIKNCGIGVAMANAVDEVKAVSDFVCDTNDNDGVAKYISELLLQR